MPQIADEELDGELEIEIVDDTPPEDRGRTPMPDEIVKDLEDDELEEYSKEKGKQLKKVWNDERRAKESAIRERDETVAVAKRLFTEINRLKGDLNTGEKAYVGTAKQNFERELELAKREFKEAYDSGDSDKVLDAQEKLLTAKMNLRQVDNYRPTYGDETLQKPENSVDNNGNGEWRAEPVQPTPPKPTDKAIEWQKRNPWWGKHRGMTGLALTTHEDLVSEGVDTQSNEYYKRLDSEIRKRFPEEFPKSASSDDDGGGKLSTNGSSRSRTVVAPATRSPSPTKVRISASAVALAKKLGITPEQYAKELIRLGNSDE